MHLQTQTRAGIDLDALDLKALTLVDAVVPAPWPVDLTVGIELISILMLQLMHKLLYVLAP
jgi:hypothetical protein